MYTGDKEAEVTISKQPQKEKKKKKEKMRPKKPLIDLIRNDLKI